MSKNNKQVILITGGSEGLGLDIACTLKGDNDVVVVSNDRESLKDVNKKYDLDTYFCDITDPNSIEEAINYVIKKYEKVDVLVNNAGVWAGGELTENSYDEIAKVVLVNTIGTIYMTKAIIPSMKENHFGKIVIIGSTNGVEAKEGRSVYAASKWGVRGFTQIMRKELQPYGIGVVGINPGLIKTKLHEHAGCKRDYSNAMPSEKVAEIVKFAIEMDDIIFEDITFRKLDAEIF